MLKPFSLITVLAMAMALSVGVVHAEDSLVNQYDPNGNLVSGDGKFYEYNDASQLAKVREKDQAGAVIAEYFYDFSGQRVKKVENGVISYYIGKDYETQVVAEKAQDTTHFFVDNERVAKRDASGTYFYHPDHLGGTNVVTNATGVVVARNSYLPFGEMREGGEEKYSYTGKEKDVATDLYYFEARFNSPELRHFTQADIADPDLDDPQDLNRYAYVGNNPMSYVDPDGHKKKKKNKSNNNNKEKNNGNKKKVKLFNKHTAKEIASAALGSVRTVGSLWSFVGITENLVDIRKEWDKPLKEIYKFDKFQGGKKFIKDFFSRPKKENYSVNNAGAKNNKSNKPDPVLDYLPEGNYTAGQGFYLLMTENYR